MKPVEITEGEREGERIWRKLGRKLGEVGRLEKLGKVKPMLDLES